MTTATRKLGIALGSGSAKGWAHIGVLRELGERGLRPDVVAGASIGSLVGAAYASGQLDVLEDWARKLTRLDVLRLLDASFSGGVIAGNRVMSAIGKLLEDRPIEELPVAFGAVATDLETGGEVWLREGPMLTAMRASSGLPGLFAPTRYEGRWLIDGGVVNPVPVSLCHALGADAVIAVNLNGDVLSRRRSDAGPRAASAAGNGEDTGGLERIGEMLGSLFGSFNRERTQIPGIIDVMGASIDIMQERITRSRMAGEPPDMLVEPPLKTVELLDFHLADDVIEAGRKAVRDMPRRRFDDLAELVA